MQAKISKTLEAIIARTAFETSKRAITPVSYTHLDVYKRQSYDRVVEVMKETGKDIPSLYRETSEGGLARNYTQK